jgi:hypothetical protein
MGSDSNLRPVPGMPISDRCVNLYVDGYNFYVPLSSGSEQDYELAWCNFWRLSELLVERLAREQPEYFEGCHLGAVKAFTATLPRDFPRDRGGIQRKQDWLDALNHVSKGRVEVTHGTFRAREHRFYIESSQLHELVRCGIPVHLAEADGRATYHPRMTVHEEKQTDVMLACSLLVDAALGKLGVPSSPLHQAPPLHLENTRPSPAACRGAIIMSADIDFLPAAEMATKLFSCPVAIAFSYPHTGYRLRELLPDRIPGLSTLHISEDELRNSMLPDEVEADGRTITLQRFKRSHLQRVRAMGG